ncbi:MAG: hypothetical protein ABW047_00040 [Nitrospiraceae bacterium]
MSRTVLWCMAMIVAASISNRTHQTCSDSERLWRKSGGDWGIGHA